MKKVLCALMVLVLCLSMAVTAFADRGDFVSSPGEDGTPCKHNKTFVVNEKDATCTEAGHTGMLVCKLCGEVLDKGHKIPALGHDFNKKGVCTICGEKKHVHCDHDKTYVKGEKAPTCTEAGHTGVVVCKYCDKVLDKGHKIPAKGHKADADGICVVCGADTNVPQTGDNSNVILWTGLMVVSAVALVGVTSFRRKRA